MKVRDVMEVDVITVPAHATYEDAARILSTKGVSGCPVVNDSGQIIGAVSEKDLFRIMYPYYRSYYESPESYTDEEAREHKIEEIRTHPVSSFMTRAVITVGPDVPIMRAGAIMLAHNVHRLPVVDLGKIVGIISRTNIYRQILKQHLTQE